MFSVPLLIVLWLTIYQILLAQPPENPRFQRISLEEGMPGRYVNAIAQDDQGFIWLGTSYGLCQYDGYEIKTYDYDPQDSTAIVSIGKFMG